MKVRKIPMRSCVVTKEKLPKGDLVRVVREPSGSVVVDKTGKANGRGAYLKRDLKVFEKAIKDKVLERHLEVEMPNTLLEELKNTL
jgi:predicted RNA-binding protein YlxR (DUF448 family)